MELILVRHARPQRVENVDTIADPALTEKGRAQAERVGEWLAHESIDHVVASPKRRAVETAEPLARRLGLDIEVVHGFSEIDRASTSYIPVEEMRAENNAHWQALMAQNWSAIGYDDPLSFRKEVAETYEQLVERHEGKRLALVAHGGTINAIVTHLLQLDTVFMFSPGYTSISRIARVENGRFMVRSLNEMAHLESGRHTLDPL